MAKNNDPAEHYMAVIDDVERMLDRMPRKPNNERAMSAITRDEMNARLETIETRMDGRLASIDSKIDTKFAEIRVEMHEGFSGMIKWVVGTGLALGVAAITIMTFVLNNATPKLATAQPQPIVIQVPSTAPAQQPQLLPK